MDIAMPLLNGLEAARSSVTTQIHVLVLDARQRIHPPVFRQSLATSRGRGQRTRCRHPRRPPRRGRSAGHHTPIEDYLRSDGAKPEPSTSELTPREREILQLIAEGYTSREIAEMLSLSVKTVQAHRTSLMQKLDLHDRGDLIKYAIQKKIIEV
jgi:DNA-binding NarL/FixJ family response regulator